jgi:hypothetical protein
MGAMITPEQQARAKINALLIAAGWVVQDRRDFNRTASLGVALQEFPHSTGLCGGTCHPSAKASRGEDLQVEEPVSRWDCSAFHFHPTVAGMLRSTLIRDQVV